MLRPKTIGPGYCEVLANPAHAGPVSTPKSSKNGPVHALPQYAQFADPPKATGKYTRRNTAQVNPSSSHVALEVPIASSTSPQTTGAASRTKTRRKSVMQSSSSIALPPPSSRTIEHPPPSSHTLAQHPPSSHKSAFLASGTTHASPFNTQYPPQSSANASKTSVSPAKRATTRAVRASTKPIATPSLLPGLSSTATAQQLTAPPPPSQSMPTAMQPTNQAPPQLPQPDSDRTSASSSTAPERTSTPAPLAVSAPAVPAQLVPQKAQRTARTRSTPAGNVASVPPIPATPSSLMEPAAPAAALLLLSQQQPLTSSQDPDPDSATSPTHPPHAFPHSHPTVMALGTFLEDQPVTASASEPNTNTPTTSETPTPPPKTSTRTRKQSPPADSLTTTASDPNTPPQTKAPAAKKASRARKQSPSADSITTMPSDSKAPSQTKARTKAPTMSASTHTQPPASSAVPTSDSLSTIPTAPTTPAEPPILPSTKQQSVRSRMTASKPSRTNVATLDSIADPSTLRDSVLEDSRYMRLTAEELRLLDAAQEVWVCVYQLVPGGDADVYMYGSPLPLPAQVAASIAQEPRFLFRVPASAGLSFTRAEKGSEGWSCYRIMICGDVGVEQEYTMWPNMVQHVAVDGDKRTVKRVRHNARDLMDVVLFLADPTHEGVLEHLRNLARIFNGTRIEQCYKWLKLRWGLGGLKSLKLKKDMVLALAAKFQQEPGWMPPVADVLLESPYAGVEQG